MCLYVKPWKQCFPNGYIRETPDLSTNGDYSTDNFFSTGVAKGTNSILVLNLLFLFLGSPLFFFASAAIAAVKGFLYFFSPPPTLMSSIMF